MGTEFDGDCLSRGINFMGIICPEGQKVGDWKSEDQMGLGPNASQPLRQFIFFLVKGKKKMFSPQTCVWLTQAVINATRRKLRYRAVVVG